MRYDFVCSVDRQHPEVEIQHSIKEDHPELHCERCGEVMIRNYKPPIMVGRTPDPPGMIQEYLEHNWHRKRAGMPKYSPDKVKRPPE